jgi:acetylornithine/N-succinyldiaminopimelate aminotransferase
MTLLDREQAVFFHTYKRLPLEITRGEGAYLYARDGTAYLDMFAGIAVNALGHAHPRVIEAIRTQAEGYIHVSNYFAQEPQILLAEALAALSGYQRVFFCNSGTEATEAAFKIARKWGASRSKSEIIGFTNGFHGRSMGALSLMDRPSYRDGFAPFLPGCTVLPFNDVATLQGEVSGATAAVLLECIQGEGGIRPVHQEMVTALLDLQQKFGFLIMADEVQSGVGRTGKFFGFEHFGLRPDVVTLAKPIGGGLPLGAVLGGSAVADVLQPGNHGTTFGGNPVACAAGLAVLNVIREQNLVSHTQTLGEYFKSQLQQLSNEFPSLIKEVRGHGLMLGIELTRPGDALVTAMRERKILVNCTDSTVLRFVPPLIIGQNEVDITITALREVFHMIG